MNSKSLMVFAGVGFELVAMIWLAVYLAEYLQSQYGFGKTAVAFSVIGALAAWIIHVVALLTWYNRQSDNSQRNNS